MKKNENDEPFDSWEQLFAVYDDIEPNPEIPHRVIEKMRRNELKSARRAKARRVWKYVAYTQGRAPGGISDWGRLFS